jgi:hypothetical protein
MDGCLIVFAKRLQIKLKFDKQKKTKFVIFQKKKNGQKLKEFYSIFVRGIWG